MTDTMRINRDKRATSNELVRLFLFFVLNSGGGTNVGTTLEIAGAPRVDSRTIDVARLVHTSISRVWVYLIGTFIREIQARYGRRAAKIASFFTLASAHSLDSKIALLLRQGRRKMRRGSGGRKGREGHEGTGKMQEGGICVCVCLAALDKIASLLIKRRSWMRPLKPLG